MGDFVHSGRAVDWILALVVLEALALIALRWRTGRGVPPAPLLANLAAGGFLLLALRAALSGVAWFWIALPLLAAFAAHLLDLRARWR